MNKNTEKLEWVDREIKTMSLRLQNLIQDQENNSAKIISYQAKIEKAEATVNNNKCSSSISSFSFT
jgi:hypothetical protein